MKGYRIAVRRTVSTGLWAGEECVSAVLLSPADPDPPADIQEDAHTGVVQVVPLPGDLNGDEEAFKSFLMWQARFAGRLPKLDSDHDRLVDEWGVGEKSADLMRAVLRAEREAVTAQLARNRRRRKERTESIRDRNTRWRSEARSYAKKSDAAKAIAQRDGVEVETVRKALVEKKPARHSVLKR